MSYQSLNSSARTFEASIASIMLPEVISALGDRAKAERGGALIGTAGLVRPRMYQELEFLFLDDDAAVWTRSRTLTGGPMLLKHAK